MMLVALFMRTLSVRDDVKGVVIGNTIGKALFSPSIVNYRKGWNPTPIRVVGTSLI